MMHVLAMQMLSEGNSRPTLAMELQMNGRRQQWHEHHNGAHASCESWGVCDNSAGSGARMQDTVAIEGRVTIDNSPTMRARVVDALKSKPAEMVVDLPRVTYIDTSGLATLVEASRIAHQQGTRPVLTGIQGQIRYLFYISHLDQLFDTAALTRPLAKRKLPTRKPMKTTKVAILILAIAAALYILVPNLSWAEDAAAAYNANHLLSHHPTRALLGLGNSRGRQAPTRE